MLKMQLIGRLGKDCQVNSANGKTVINFNVAVTKKINGENRTTWIECAYWTDKTAIAPYLQKGTLVYIEGEPVVNSYTSSDGQAKASQRCNVFQVQLLGRSGDSEAQETTSRQGNGSASQDDASDDLPF